MSRLARRIISYTENPATPLAFYIFTFVGSIALRIFLEIFSDTSKIPFTFQAAGLSISADKSIAISLAHYIFFWIALWLSFVLAVTYVTKESANKTLRALLAFSWIIAITPVADLLISGGKGIPIRYIRPTGFLSMFPFPQALNPGEKITVTFGLALIFIYCLVKTGRIGKSFLASGLVYFFSLLSFIPPFIAEAAARLFRVQIQINSPFPLIRLFAIISLAETVAILRLVNKGYFQAAIKKIDALKISNLVLFFILGMLLFRKDIPGFALENWGAFLLNIIVITLGWLAAALLVDWKGEGAGLAAGVHKNMFWLVFTAASLCALAVNLATVYFFILALGVVCLYLLPPLKIKRLPVFSKLPLAFIIVLLVISGWLFAGGRVLEFPRVFILYFLIFYTLCLNFLDLEGYSKKDRFVIGTFFVITYLLVPWVFLEKLLFLPALLLGLTQFYLLNRKKYSESLVLILHIVSLLALAVWLNSFHF